MDQFLWNFGGQVQVVVEESGQKEENRRRKRGRERGTKNPIEIQLCFCINVVN